MTWGYEKTSLEIENQGSTAKVYCRKWIMMVLQWYTLRYMYFAGKEG